MSTARVRHRLDIGSSPAANIGDIQPMSNIHVNIGLNLSEFRDPVGGQEATAWGHQRGEFVGLGAQTEPEAEATLQATHHKQLCTKSKTCTPYCSCCHHRDHDNRETAQTEGKKERNQHTPLYCNAIGSLPLASRLLRTAHACSETKAMALVAPLTPQGHTWGRVNPPKFGLECCSTQ
jgi:hypothetical protein